ncbi:Shiga toxin subunit A, partial [Escherichia coli]
MPSKQSVTGSNPVQRATLIFPGSLLRAFFISAPGLVLITSAKRNTLYMKCILFKWVLCLLLGFSSVSYSREFTIDFSTQQS